MRGSLRALTACKVERVNVITLMWVLVLGVGTILPLVHHYRVLGLNGGLHKGASSASAGKRFSWWWWMLV